MKLCVQLPDMAKSSDSMFLWHDARGCSKEIISVLKDAALLEAESYRKQYEQEVQSVFSRVQHHWHLKDKEGKRVPMKYCRMRSNKEDASRARWAFRSTEHAAIQIQLWCSL